MAVVIDHPGRRGAPPTFAGSLHRDTNPEKDEFVRLRRFIADNHPELRLPALRAQAGGRSSG